MISHWSQPACNPADAPARAHPAAPAGTLVPMGDQEIEVGLRCPSCREPWLRPSSVPGRYRCVNCLHRFELRSVCPGCGEHQTIVRMASTATTECGHCGSSMLVEV